MESKKLICDQCRESQNILHDSFTGLWEMPIGHASISNTSWEYLEKTWREIHRQDCQEKILTQ